MTRIPIDLTAPIACTAGPDELPRRIEQIGRLRDRLRAVDRTEEGLLLHFESDDYLTADLQRFVAEEKGCCRFWGFEITESSDLTLRWDGPPEVQPFLDELLRYFESDEPLTAFAGLL